MIYLVKKIYYLGKAEYYGNVHVYCPGVGAYEPLGSNFFQNH